MIGPDTPPLGERSKTEPHTQGQIAATIPALLGYEEGEFPVAEALAREALSLPLFPGVSLGQLEYVASSVREFFTGC